MRALTFNIRRDNLLLILFNLMRRPEAMILRVNRYDKKVHAPPHAAGVIVIRLILQSDRVLQLSEQPGHPLQTPFFR